MFVTVVPAYGRDYKSKKEVLADWEANKDFKIECMAHPNNGCYINLADTKGLSDTFTARYKKLTATVKLPNLKV